jgi:hypothetical protein
MKLLQTNASFITDCKITGLDGFGYAAVIFMEALLEIWHPCSSLLYGILYVV